MYKQKTVLIAYPIEKPVELLDAELNLVYLGSSFLPAKERDGNGSHRQESLEGDVCLLYTTLRWVKLTSI